MGFRNPASVPASIFLHFVTGHSLIFTSSSSSGLIFPTGSKLLRRPWGWLIVGVGVALTEAFRSRLTVRVPDCREEKQALSQRRNSLEGYRIAHVTPSHKWIPVVKRQVGSCVCSLCVQGHSEEQRDEVATRALLDPGQRTVGAASWSAGLLPDLIQGRGGQRLALENGGLPGLGWGSRCPQLRGSTSEKKGGHFLPPEAGGLHVLLSCVFESAPAVSRHARACSQRGEDPHGFHQSPEIRAFDPRAPKKRSGRKRFNVFESLLFHQVVQIFYDVHRS